MAITTPVGQEPSTALAPIGSNSSDQEPSSAIDKMLMLVAEGSVSVMEGTAQTAGKIEDLMKDMREVIAEITTENEQLSKEAVYLKKQLSLRETVGQSKIKAYTESIDALTTSAKDVSRRVGIVENQFYNHQHAKFGPDGCTSTTITTKPAVDCFPFVTDNLLAK